MCEPLAPLNRAPASVHAPFVCYPGGQYRHEPVAERRAALLAALHGVTLGAHDQRILHWLASDEVTTVATVVSPVWRARHTATTRQTRQGGGQPR